MRHTRALPIALAVAAAVSVTGCNREQRATVDTAAGAVETTVRAALSVLDVDVGRRIGTDSTVTDKTDNFLSADTVYASVRTSGTAQNSAVVARWTFEDGSVVDETTNSVTTSGEARTVFRLSKQGGLSKGKYTLRILVDGKEVRSKEFSVA
jgi:predicted small secreted protein